MATCCNLVGNFEITKEGIISISSKGDTPVQLFTDGTNNSVSIAPSTGSVSITAYAGNVAHDGCAGKAGVAINWVTRTDCDKNVYLFGGPGKSYKQGYTANYVKFPAISAIENPVNNYKIVDASASSGPNTIYYDDFQYDGYGLIYNGTPWSINTTNEDECKINLSSYGIGDYGECMLQNLSLTCTPAQIPTVSLDFIYSIGG